MSTTQKTYYIACAKSIEVPDAKGNVMTEAGRTLYFGEEDCYSQLSTSENGAKHFDRPPSQKLLRQWQGMPWYHRFDPGSVKVFKIEHRVIIERTRIEPV